MQSIEEQFTALYAAFNARKIDEVFATLSPDVDWPNGMEGGRVHGYAEVRAYWTRQWEVVDPHVEPVRVVETEPGRVAVDVHQVVRDRGGALLIDQMVRHVYTLVDGKVVHMDIQPWQG